MSKSHTKGYAYENYVMKKMRAAFPFCERAAAGRIKGDLIGTGDWAIECKHHKALTPGKWVKRLEEIHPHNKWILAMRDGNSVLVTSLGDITITPIPCPAGYDYIPALKEEWNNGQWRIHSFVERQVGGGILPAAVRVQGKFYYIQTLEATIATLRQTKCERAVNEGRYIAAIS